MKGMVTMANYLNLKFENTRQDFTKWTNKFPSIFRNSPDNDVLERKISKQGNLYCEALVVQDRRNESRAVFSNIREYDADEQDFEIIASDRTLYHKKVTFEDMLFRLSAKYDAEIDY